MCGYRTTEGELEGQDKREVKVGVRPLPEGRASQAERVATAKAKDNACFLCLKSKDTHLLDHNVGEEVRLGLIL